MKRKISVRLSELIIERLEVAASVPGGRKSSIVEAALDLFLEDEADASESAMARHLKRISRRLDELQSDLKIVAETVALHARYHLTITPPLRVADQADACAIGSQRFHEFVAQVARRVHLENPLMRETMDRILATRPNLFAHEQNVPVLGAQMADSANASIAAHQDGELATGSKRKSESSKGQDATASIS
jgi:hypothetical protein